MAAAILANFPDPQHLLIGSVSYHDPHCMVNSNRYGLIEHPVRVVIPIPTKSDLGIPHFFRLFDLQDGLCTPHEMATKYIFFFNEFRDAAVTTKARELRWTAIVSQHVISTCDSESLSKSAEDRDEIIWSLKQVWWYDSNIGLPDGIDAQSIGIGRLCACWKLHYKASRAKLLQDLVTFEPRFLAVELQDGRHLTKNEIENAQRKLETLLKARARTDRLTTNTIGDNGNKTRSLHTPAVE